MSKRKSGPWELIVFCFIACLSSALGKAQDSVADAARKNHPKDAPVATKRIWTDDDFPSAGKKESTVPVAGTQESASETLQKFRLLDRYNLGVAVLKRANAPNVEFPDRKDWEQRLFEAKNTWSDQVDRMVAHKDSSKDALDTELRLAQGAQRIFERIETEGIQQARAVNDPMLRAHLEYQRQQESCRQYTGDLLDQCRTNLEQRRLQMQREGIW